jgi:hypothetical protein
MTRSAAIGSPPLRQVARSVLCVAAGAAHVAHLWPEVDVLRLAGPSWSAIFMGDPHVRRLLEPVLFEEPPAATVIGRVHIAALQPAVDRALDEVPLVVCALPQWFPGRWRPASPLTFRTPVFVDHLMDLRVPLEDQLRGTARQEVRRLVVKARALGVVARPSGSERDFERFHREILEPFLRSRHGAQAIVDRCATIAARLRRPDYEFVELVLGDKAVGGMVLRFVGHECLSEEMGLRTDLAPAVARLLPTQAFLSGIDRALARGCSTFHFGGSLAFYGDPVFRAKRRWGVRTVQRDRLTYPEWTWLARDLSGGLARRIEDLGPLTFHEGRSCIVRLRDRADAGEHMPHADGVEGYLVVSPGEARFVAAPHSAAVTGRP